MIRGGLGMSYRRVRGREQVDSYGHRGPGGARISGFAIRSKPYKPSEGERSHKEAHDGKVRREDGGGWVPQSRDWAWRKPRYQIAG